MKLTAIAKRWKVLSGHDDWKNLLDPLDLDLRRYLLHYGERAQATYDAFNSDEKSVYAGSCKYAKNHLFARVGLKKANPYEYRVVNYFYATSKIHVPAAFLLESKWPDPWCKGSNWMGYVAVATDNGKKVLGRRDILIAWRGTVQNTEWAINFNFPLASASEIFGEGTLAQVHGGFLSIYTSSNPSSRLNEISARDQIIPTVQQLIEEYKDEEVSISVTGHSLGAALSTLTATDIAYNGFNKAKSKPNKPCPVTVFGFGSPLLGNSSFKDIAHSTKNLHILRVRNIPDRVTILPPFLGYVDVGEELEIDNRKSKFLNYKGDFDSWHDLEAAYLHGVAGAHGANGDFHLEVNRDIALANKKTDLVKDQYLVPGDWWVQSNKGMIQKENGFWVLEDHEL